MEIISNSTFKTESFGQEVAVKMIKKKSDKAVVIGLQGDLGGGKTTFLKGFAIGLGIKEPVLSPTFIIFRKYNLKYNLKYNQNRGGFKNFYHFDCYRIENEEEILNLGFSEIVSNPKNIVAIEWSEMIEGILPSEIIRIKFEFIDEETRKILIS